MPEEDFAKELLKALALLDINPKLKQPGNDAILRGIAWSQVSSGEHVPSLYLCTILYCAAAVPPNLFLGFLLGVYRGDVYSFSASSL